MKTITFYSYKGGVGRSLALANIADRLSEFNKNVCLLDFDLEAPGLPYKFLKHFSKPIKKGIVDYIHGFTSNGILPDRISDYAIPFRPPSGKSDIHLIPAGDIDQPDYWKKLGSINWFNLLYESGNGLAFFLDLKQKIKKELNPDFLLIDSRTGISDMSGVSIAFMADEVVVLAANNMENLSGSKRIIQSLQKPENSIFGEIPKITFVLTRIPFTDKPEDKVKEQTLLDKVKNDFSTLISDVLPIHSDRDLEESEQIKIGYLKDETGSQVSKDYLNLFESLTKDVLTKDEIQTFQNKKRSEDWYRKAKAAESISQKMEFLDEALALNESNFILYFYKGLILNAAKDYSRAIEAYSKADKLAPGISAILVEIGQANIKLGKYDLAEKNYLDSIAIGGSDASAYLGLGIVQSFLGRHPEAIKSYSKALELDPINAIAYNNRGNAYRILGDLDGALKDVYKALELDPDLPISYSTLAEINVALGNMNEFFLNLETYIRSMGSERIEEVKKTIISDKSYERFYKEERFKKLMNKYSITLL